MNNKLNRIDSFLRELAESGLTDEQKSVVLQPVMAELDGGDNGGTCVNSGSGCNHNTGDCTNFGSACENNTNDGPICVNKDLVHYVSCGGTVDNPCYVPLPVGKCVRP